MCTNVQHAYGTYLYTYVRQEYVFNVCDLAQYTLVYTHQLQFTTDMLLTAVYFSIFIKSRLYAEKRTKKKKRRPFLPLHSEQILYKFVLHGTCNTQISDMESVRWNRNNNNMKNYYTCVCIASGVFCKKKTPSLRVCRTQIICRSVGASSVYDHSILSATLIPIQHLFIIHFIYACYIVTQFVHPDDHWSGGHGYSRTQTDTNETKYFRRIPSCVLLCSIRFKNRYIKKVYFCFVIRRANHIYG